MLKPLIVNEVGAVAEGRQDCHVQTLQKVFPLHRLFQKCEPCLKMFSRNVFGLRNFAVVWNQVGKNLVCQKATKAKSGSIDSQKKHRRQFAVQKSDI